MTEIVKTVDLCVEANVSRTMISRWSREGMKEAAQVSHGKWDREKALSWIADRREDSAALDGRGLTSGDLLEARVRLYRVQAEGAEIRNKAAEAHLVYRERATGAFSTVTSECIVAGDAWARDHSTKAAAPLRDVLSAAQVIALKSELWHELRAIHQNAVERVSADLAAGEDVGATRIRVAG